MWHSSVLPLLWLVPFLPLLGFVVLIAGGIWFQERWSREFTSFIGVGSVTLSALLSVAIAVSFHANAPPDHRFSQQLWTWFSVGALNVGWNYTLDPLALLMILVVTIVGALIHLYSTEFMRGDDSYNRFFAYLNLFVASMLILILGSNLLVLYLGWEGVGLCSYLLIGFWYKDQVNGAAARKAFIVTRVGDAFMAIGLFLLFSKIGTLDIQPLLQAARTSFTVGSAVPVIASLLLVGGAVGKSAQLPLQTWLPDAMAGPTPVSALIHAATMVTAGVYLIARMHPLFELAPQVLLLVGVLGAATLLLAGFSALVQWDIKRILAYSTISQIGYMFLALGVSAFIPAMFHFMTHAFFKALLFLGAGVAILNSHHEHSIFKLHEFRRSQPILFWTFLIGAGSLAAVPFITSGFYSKDLILAEAYTAGGAGRYLWFAGLLGAFLTSLYTFRMFFIGFFTPRSSDASTQLEPTLTVRSRLAFQIPLILLAALALISGFWETGITNFLGPSFASAHEARTAPSWLAGVASIVSLLGVTFAAILFLNNRKQYNEEPQSRLGRFWLHGWNFDLLYDTLFVRPYLALARANQNDAADLLYRFIAWFARKLNQWLSRTQDGQLRWYAAGLASGTAFILAITILALWPGRKL